MSEGACREAVSREEVLAGLERALGHPFERPELLATALRHTSFAHESGEGESNERLEFLGDSVLGLVVAHALFEAHPQWREGDLTRALHARRRRALARAARPGSRARPRPRTRANGAQLGRRRETVDPRRRGGSRRRRALRRRGTSRPCAASSTRALRPPSPRTQHRSPVTRRPSCRSGRWPPPACFPGYRVVADSGVEGDDRRFTVEVSLRGEALAQATDRTKRAAEREAARIALAAGHFEADHAVAGE